MDKVTLALLLIAVVHIVGAAVLIALLMDSREWRQWWPRDDRGGGDDPPPDDGGPPLPDAGSADARLRTEHDRFGHRRRRVRSAPEPERRPARERTAR